MALFVFQASVVKRSKGQSVIARAAYNSRSNMNDERTGDRHGRWSEEVRNAEVEFSEIFAPKNAPAWARDREKLWNEVEAREDRPTAGLNPATAQLARDFKIAIPHELNKQQREWLVKDFARELMRKGMVVDVNIHIPEEGKDERNYHVHMLLTMREIGPDGFGKKNREWNKKEFLEGMRERWAELGAKQLDRAGFHLEAERYKVAHLTLDKQKEKAEERRDWAWAKELDREPTKHMGPEAWAMEQKGIPTRNGDKNRDISERNYARSTHGTRNAENKYKGIPLCRALRYAIEPWLECTQSMRGKSRHNSHRTSRPRCNSLPALSRSGS